MSVAPETIELAWLDELNPQQRDAATHGDGPLLVVAGAGSGKTKTLAYRVAHLIQQGVDPERILLLTFTRRAAEEMLKRAEGIVVREMKVTGRVWGGTFHAMANRLLRMYAKPAGLSPDFTVMDQSDAEDLMNVIRHDLNLSKRETRFPRKTTCLSIYSRCVSGSEDIETVLLRHFPWCKMWGAELKELFKNYVGRKQEQDVLDYDDLLLYWRELLRNEELADSMEGRFDHVLIDEYQDTNVVQAHILQGMRRQNQNITIVGDDAQSIYSFRSASFRNMLDFPNQFPGASVVTLEQNYRSTPPILTTTNALITQARERYSKELWSARDGEQRPKLVTCKDEAQQDKYIVERILEHYEEGIPLKKMAVLFRTSYHADSLELALTRHNIPYHKYGGLKFLESAHIKDLVAFLRITENPRDQMAWFRVLQLLDGVGPNTASRAMRHIAQHGHDVMQLQTFKAPPAAREGLQGLITLMHELAELGDKAPAANVERIRTFYEPIFEKNYDNPTVRIHDLESLEQIASGYTSRQKFLTDLTLDPPESTGDLAGPPSRDEDWMTLSTIHSAKGCEWDVVFVIHVADGCIPSDMSTGSNEEIEEELRLLYVAMTRARDFLYVTWPLRYYHKWKSRFTDAHSYAQRCRFLSDEVCASCEEEYLSQGRDSDTHVEIDVGEDIAAKMRSMWE